MKKLHLVLTFLTVLSISWAQEETAALTFKIEPEEIEEVEEVRVDTSMLITRSILGIGGWIVDEPEYESIQYSKLDLGRVPRVVYSGRYYSKIDLSHNRIKRFNAKRRAVNTDTLMINNNNLKHLNLRAADSQMTLLDASNNALEHVDIFYTRLNYLEYIDLSGNRLEKMPRLRYMPSMQVFMMERNELTHVSTSLKNMKYLEHVSFADNNIKRFPKALTRMKNLRSIDLSNNEIKDLPIRVARLPHLQRIDVRGNKIPQAQIEHFKTIVGEDVEFLY